tara:strand:- start:187 stop:1095 length:909 start_codon:yes stop_codon:yes gene_type:complete
VSWLDRQSFLGLDSDVTLDQVTIGIVGLGGGGSHVAQQLAHVGVGHFVVIDPELIEDTNLNRLVGGTQADVENAAPKVDVTRRLILGVRPAAKVESIRAQWQAASNALKRCDIIVGGLDSVRAKDELDAFCHRFLIPYIDMGMDVFGDAGRHLIAGQVVLSSPGMPCLRCLHIVTDEMLAREAANYGAAGGKPQVVWPNGVLASTAVGLVMQLLVPWHQSPLEGAYLVYDGNKGVVAPSHRYEHALEVDCPHYPPEERGEPQFDVRKLPFAVLETKGNGAPIKHNFLKWVRDTVRSAFANRK